MSKTQRNDANLSTAIEALLVARNPRNMQVASAALQPGYYLRAAKLLQGISGNVVIGTGFPVADTFETDGPVGAIALYDTLQCLGAKPVMACGTPLYRALGSDYRTLELRARDLAGAEQEARDVLSDLRPEAIVSIERPGLGPDGRYYNMRGEDITAKSGFFDFYLSCAACPTIAVGDGGNEIGMGNIAHVFDSLDIKPSATHCDELLVADVSNWGAYGLIAMLGVWSERDLLSDIDPLAILEYLSQRGSVDGVTRNNTLTEDGLDADEGLSVIQQLRELTGYGAAL